MAASTPYRFTPALPYLFSSSTDKTSRPIHPPCFNSFKPVFSSKLNLSSIKVYRSEFSSSAAAKLTCRVLTVNGLVCSHYIDSISRVQSAAIELRLPRKSLLVQCTCDLCGERTKRLVNRLANERGVVFVQCARCLRHHRLVDNLGLIIEYDVREETNMD